MFWGSRTSSYNDVTFWLKLASTFYALFYFIPGSWYDSHVACSDFFWGVLFLQLFAVLQFLMTCHQQTSLLHLISLRPLRGVDVTASVGGPQVFSPDFHRPSIAFSRTQQLFSAFCTSHHWIAGHLNVRCMDLGTQICIISV